MKVDKPFQSTTYLYILLNYSEADFYDITWCIWLDNKIIQNKLLPLYLINETSRSFSRGDFGTTSKKHHKLVWGMYHPITLTCFSLSNLFWKASSNLLPTQPSLCSKTWSPCGSIIIGIPPYPSHCHAFNPPTRQPSSSPCIHPYLLCGPAYGAGWARAGPPLVPHLDPDMDGRRHSKSSPKLFCKDMTWSHKDQGSCCLKSCFLLPKCSTP